MTEDKEKKPKAAKKVEVRVVAQEGESALAEWAEEGDLRRAYVPVGKVEGGRCDLDALNAGITYGVPWEDLIDVSGLTREAVGRELRRKGFWTSADINDNMRIVQRAVNAATGLSAASLYTLAREYESKEA